MANTPTTSRLQLEKEQEVMIGDVLILVFCFLMALGALTVVAWEVATGRVFDMDGLWLTLISLTLVAVFGGNLAWSAYQGEVQRILSHLRKGSKKAAASGESPTGPA
jgi:ABC-type nickel/cobalt efflux system permease component RcnA